jgi:hypothetical protein
VTVPGGHTIVVRVPRSWQDPHLVSIRNTRRFYVRNSSGVHQPSVEELSAMFGRTRSATEKVKDFRKERIEALFDGDSLVPLTYGNGQFVLHVVPLSYSDSAQQIDISKACTQKIAWQRIPRPQPVAFIQAKCGPLRLGSQVWPASYGRSRISNIRHCRQWPQKVGSASSLGTPTSSYFTKVTGTSAR